jgi:flagellar biosynthesis protein FliQ
LLGLNGMRRHRPHTPLLFVLLGVAIFIAATTLVASHIQFTPRVLEPFVMTALVAAVGGTRIFVR